MLPRHMTLSRCRADSAKLVPCGRAKPRRRFAVTSKVRELLAEPCEKVDVVVADDATDTLRSSGGHAKSAGVGEVDGDGDELRPLHGESGRFRPGVFAMSSCKFFFFWFFCSL